LIQRARYLLYLAPILFPFACTPHYADTVAAFRVTADNPAPIDYSKLENWAAHPDKNDPSDSVPEPLIPGSIKDTGVDVFFLHPTTLTSARDKKWNGDIHDSALNAKTDASTILFQASAFNECRVFAPRYRQAHIRAYYSRDTVSARDAFDLAYGDLKAAFQYYLDHYNHGRPIIIASHSQGTSHAKRLLKEFFENGPLKDRLVAAYIIGMAIPGDYFTGLPTCADSTSTGCVIGWRTYKRGTEPHSVQEEGSPSLVVNPLTWTTTDEYAPRSLNRGAVLTKFNKLFPAITDAQIHGGILWVHRPHFPGSFLIRTSNYHIGDINLFYLNIRDNVRTRIRYFEKRR
jgi:hypothetical protein